jgi:hypothetical protein
VRSSIIFALLLLHARHRLITHISLHLDMDKCFSAMTCATLVSCAQWVFASALGNIMIRSMLILLAKAGLLLRSFWMNRIKEGNGLAQLVYFRRRDLHQLQMQLAVHLRPSRAANSPV